MGRTTTRTAKRTAAFWGAGLAGLFLLAGCGGGGGGSESPGERLPGAWRASRLEVAGQSTNCAGEINYIEDGTETSVSCGANDTVTFFENGAFTATSAEGAYAGTWRLSGSTLTVTITTPPASVGTESERINFSGDNTFTADTEDGTKVTFTRA